MSEDFDDLLKGWLRDRGAIDQAAIDGVAGRVAALPPRRRRQPSPIAAAASIIVALGLAAFALVPRQGSGSSQPSSPVAPDPAAFAADLRLARCSATAETALAAFEMTRARDYRLHLPALGRSPELEVDAPGFVVVFREMHPFPVFGAPPPSGETWPPRSLAPGHHDVCVLVGSDPATAELTIYTDVDTTGLTAFVDSVEPSSGVEPATPSASTSPPAPAITPEPGPAWAGDARAALACAGAPSTFGTGYSPGTDAGAAATPLRAVAYYLRAVDFFDNPMPRAGYVERAATDDARLFTVNVGASAKAAIVVVFRGPGPDKWIVSSVASCDEAEFDPTTPTGRHPIGIWTDAAGAEVPSSILAGIPDCYGGTQVRFRDRLYVRIPNGGVDPGQLEMTWSRNATLPVATTRTPYESGGRRLHTRDDGRAIYFVDPDRIERLPHVIGDEVSRTDCN
jgi:hypothetical protein